MTSQKGEVGGRLKNELQLIKKIQKYGDRDAADQLIRFYYDEIYGYVFKQILDKHQAMDISQEIFITVLRSIHTYNAAKSSFRTWLYRVSTNKLIDYYRKNDRTSSDKSISDQVLTDESELFIDFNNKYLLDKINHYLTRVEISSQQVFRLKVFGNYLFKEIAIILSLPESTVKSKYYRLLKTVREEFSDEYE